MVMVSKIQNTMPQRIGVQKLSNNQFSSGTLTNVSRERNVKKSYQDYLNAQANLAAKQDEYSNTFENFDEQTALQKKTEYEQALAGSASASDILNRKYKAAYGMSNKELEANKMSIMSELEQGNTRSQAIDYTARQKEYMKERDEYLATLQDKNVRTDYNKEEQEYLQASDRMLGKATPILFGGEERTKLASDLQAERDSLATEKVSVFAFNNKLGELSINEDDYVGKREQYFGFLNQSRDLIQNSARNFAIYEDLDKKYNVSPDEYGAGFLNNPEYTKQFVKANTVYTKTQVGTNQYANPIWGNVASTVYENVADESQATGFVLKSKGVQYKVQENTPRYKYSRDKYGNKIKWDADPDIYGTMSKHELVFNKEGKLQEERVNDNFFERIIDGSSSNNSSVVFAKEKNVFGGNEILSKTEQNAFMRLEGNGVKEKELSLVSTFDFQKGTGMMFSAPRKETIRKAPTYQPKEKSYVIIDRQQGQQAVVYTQSKSGSGTFLQYGKENKAYSKDIGMTSKNVFQSLGTSINSPVKKISSPNFNSKFNNMSSNVFKVPTSKKQSFLRF
jgi:hypothetical protein